MKQVKELENKRDMLNKKIMEKDLISTNWNLYLEYNKQVKELNKQIKDILDNNINAIETLVKYSKDI